MYRIIPPYTNIEIANQSSCEIADHMGGFDSNLHNALLDTIASQVKHNFTVHSEYVLDHGIAARYSDLSFVFSYNLWHAGNNIDAFSNYHVHPDVQFKNFLCSFNGSAHVGRKLLTAIMHRLGWFDYEYSSKNFVMSCDKVDGHLLDLVGDRAAVMRKFFLGHSSEIFFNTKFSVDYTRFDHAKNLQTLQKKITGSFLHLVSESLPTSYYPFVTEKFLYSIVTRGLFLAYAQPGWHDHLETKFGFRKYNKIFDYRFDQSVNAVDRLIELVSMLAKFSALSKFDWHDLYQMEASTIEHNYHHFFSKDYIKLLQCHG